MSTRTASRPSRPPSLSSRFFSFSTALLCAALGVLLVGGCKVADIRRSAHAEPVTQSGDAGSLATPRTKPAVASTNNKASPTPASPTPAPPPPPEPQPAQPAQVERLLVPGDLMASIVRSKDGSAPVTVFMPGMCSNGAAYLHTFPEAARKQGGIVAIEGDQPCGSPTSGYRSFSWDAGRQHARVEAALAAAGLSEIPREGVTLVGYSQGAALAEQMVQRWPGRYARIVLIGAPTNPAPQNLAHARAVVTMSCDRDVPTRMKQAATATSKAGVPATYFEMPGCTHGNVTDGERIFDATFDWLHANERPADPQTTVVRIAGSPLS